MKRPQRVNYTGAVEGQIEDRTEPKVFKPKVTKKKMIKKLIDEDQE